MKEYLVIFMWDTDGEVFTRPSLVSAKSKELKFKGKKPNKALVPESCVDIKVLRKIKSICSYNAKIVQAKGK